jgi:hypothetical protein
LTFNSSFSSTNRHSSKSAHHPTLIGIRLPFRSSFPSSSSPFAFTIISYKSGLPGIQGLLAEGRWHKLSVQVCVVYELMCECFVLLIVLCNALRSVLHSVLLSVLCNALRSVLHSVLLAQAVRAGDLSHLFHFISILRHNTSNITIYPPIPSHQHTVVQGAADGNEQQHAFVKNTLRSLMTPFLPPFYRLFMAGLVPSGEWCGVM